MADTKHGHGHDALPVEGDGVNYRAILWFLVILVITVLISQLVVWGFFELSEWRIARSEAPRAPLAAPASRPLIENGTVVAAPGAVLPQGRPSLLVNEPMALERFRRAETESLHTYGWINRGAETIRLPIDRAKELVLERGLPVRPGVAAAETPAEAAPAPAAPVTPAAPAAH